METSGLPGLSWVLPRPEAVLRPAPRIEFHESELRRTAGIIEGTLRSFGIRARVVMINRGPVFIEYGIETDTRIRRIVDLKDDLALALSAREIEIEPSRDGYRTISIFLLNRTLSPVALLDATSELSDASIRTRQGLRLFLGRNRQGEPLFADLTKTAHLGVFGRAQSGKSAFCHSVILNLCLYHSPDELRLVLFDFKGVEFAAYRKLPHLLEPIVETDEQAADTIRVLGRELKTRVSAIKEAGAHNLATYNLARSTGRLPYWVFIWDDATISMMGGESSWLSSLANLMHFASQVGVLFVLAASQPNNRTFHRILNQLASRIVFQVGTSAESRLVVGESGAERLHGRGDALAVGFGLSGRTRIQTCLTSPSEQKSLIDHWRSQPMASSSRSALPGTDLVETSENAAFPVATKAIHGKDDADLITKAIAIVRSEDKASISRLQRKLRIGYVRAARLVDDLERRGIVGPPRTGQQFREVLRPNDGSSV